MLKNPKQIEKKISAKPQPSKDLSHQESFDLGIFLSSFFVIVQDKT